MTKVAVSWEWVDRAGEVGRVMKEEVYEGVRDIFGGEVGFDGE